MALDMNTQMRLTGLASGLDTDALIQNLGRVSTMRVDAVKRDRQLALWRQDAFRNTINMVSGFMRKNLDIANPLTNFRSANAFAKFSYNLSMKSDPGDTGKTKAASVVSVTANGDLKNYNQSVQAVAQLASKDTWKGDELGLRGVKSSGFDIDNFVPKYSYVSGSGEVSPVIAAPSFSFGMSIDGVSRTVTLDGTKIMGIMDGKYVPSGSAPSVDLLDQYVFVPDSAASPLGSMKSVRDFLKDKGVDVAAGVKYDDLPTGDPLIQDIDNALSGQKLFAENPGYSKEATTKEFVSYLNDQITKQFGKDFQNIVQVTESGEIRFNKPASTVTILSEFGAETLKKLGLPTGGATSAINVNNTKISALFDFGDLFTLRGVKDGKPTVSQISQTIVINGVQISVSGDDTIATLTSKISSSQAGVDLTYNSASDRFTLTAKTEGTTANVEDITGAGALLFEKLGIGQAVLVESKTEDGSRWTGGVGYKLVANGELDWEKNRFVTAGERPEVKQFGPVAGDGYELKFSNGDVKRYVIGGDGKFHEQADDGMGNWAPTGWSGAFSDLNRIMAGVTSTVEKVGDRYLERDDHGNPAFVYKLDSVSGKFMKYEMTDSTLTDLNNLVNDSNLINPSSERWDSINDALGIKSTGSRSEGANLIAVINGVEFTRQSNSFRIDGEGITYTFNSTFNVPPRGADGEIVRDGNKNIELANPADEIKIQINKNSAEIVDSIKNFVKEYNDLIDHINGLLTGKKDREFRPLSDDEKKAMKKEDIEAYEEKAKIGLMANDADLRKLLDQMRSAIYQKVEGVGLTMADIGITTSPNWKDGGRLNIDENKLQKAIDGSYDQVVALFSKASTISASDMAQRGKRMSGSGIAQRLNDIMNDAVRTTRDSYNNKGYLIEKAGTVNDASQYQNQIQKQVDTYDKRISSLLERWYRQESSYYSMFARMETAMMKMQSQQNNLASLMANQGK